jgi:hypothetical protein
MALISPDTDLRIRNNTLYTREREAGDGAGAGPWRNRGSASGVSLDVGRELLMHPFLLEPAATRKTRGTIRGSYAVEPRAFRRYVADERNGLVTDLLQDASSLTLDATTRNGQLWSDSFALTTRIPRSLEPRLAGRTLMLTGVTQTCA